MKKVKKINLFLFIIFIPLLMTACGKSDINNTLSNEALKICGSWAYIHDKETAIAVFHEDGSAEYEGKNYSFDCDNQYITLKDKKGNTKQLRYMLDDEGMYLYSNNTYTFTGNSEPASLIGEWVCKEKNWSYIFTDNGTFMEDGIFPGYYTVDNENSTFKLIYNDQFEDTVCYFILQGNQIQIEYPWRMLKISN